MRCKCCFYDVSDNLTQCPVCQFPTYSSGGSGVDKLADSFRANHLKDISVAVKFYYYERNEYGELTEQKNEYVTIADAVSLVHHEVTWFGEEFNPPETNRDIQVELKLTYAGKSVEKNITAKIEKPLSCARLGLYLDNGFAVCVAVGKEDNYILSERTDLLLHSNQ